jgi:hypothetical protein
MHLYAARVLQVKGDDLRFAHQLLQEYLASRVLLDANRSAGDFWARPTWAQRLGGGGEIAAESLRADGTAQV